MKELHANYIKAGARVITTNTYATVQKRVKELILRGRIDREGEEATQVVRPCGNAAEHEIERQ